MEASSLLVKYLTGYVFHIIRTVVVPVAMDTRSRGREDERKRREQVIQCWFRTYRRT